MENKYKPKPAELDEIGVSASIQGIKHMDFFYSHENLRDIFSDAALNVIKASVGRFPEERSYRGTDNEDMRNDPYLVHHYLSGVDSCSWKDKVAQFKKRIVSARECGLWTLHSDSGSSIGVCTNRPYIRINPKALHHAVRCTLGSNPVKIDYPRCGSPDIENPGWRFFQEYKYSKDKCEILRLYLDWCSGRILLSRKEGKVIFKDTQEKSLPHKDFMEQMLTVFKDTDRIGSEDKEDFEKIFPKVSFEVFDHNLYTQTSLAKEEKKLEDLYGKLKEATKNYKELRDIIRSAKKLGGPDGILDQMGKDLKEALLLNSMDWLLLDDRGYVQEESRFSPVLAFKYKAAEALTQGLIKLPE
jgi:hypothetical protein